MPAALAQRAVRCMSTAMLPPLDTSSWRGQLSDCARTYPAGGTTSARTRATPARTPQRSDPSDAVRPSIRQSPATSTIVTRSEGTTRPRLSFATNTIVASETGVGLVDTKTMQALQARAASRRTAPFQGVTHRRDGLGDTGGIREGHYRVLDRKSTSWHVGHPEAARRPAKVIEFPRVCRGNLTSHTMHV